MLLLIIVNFIVGFAVGLAAIYLKLEWFARFGTIALGIFTCVVTPHPLSIAFLLGFFVQSSMRFWHLKTGKSVTIVIPTP